MEKEFDKKKTETVPIKEEDAKLNHNNAATSPFGHTCSVPDELTGAVAAIEEIRTIKADLSDAIETNNAREIFDYFDIGVFINRNGTYGISEYRQPSDFITFSDIGINEEKLIENVVKISGNADFRKSKLVNFGKIQYIGGRVDIRNSNFKPFMKLPKIGGKIIFYEHQTLLQGIFIKFLASICRLVKK